MLAHTTFGRTNIAFEVERSAARKSVAIAVLPTGRVVVKAPAALPAERIPALVKSRGAWVVQRLADVRELEPTRPEREFVSGEMARYLGRQYRLHVVRGQEAEVKLKGGFLTVTVPRSVPVGARSHAVRGALVGWYRARAEERLPERVRLLARRVRVAPAGVLVRDQALRWASCSPRGELRFNWRLVMAPMSLVDYVIAHELCHLRVADHSVAFWRLLQRVLPDQAARRERLRREGGSYLL